MSNKALPTPAFTSLRWKWRIVILLRLRLPVDCWTCMNGQAALLPRKAKLFIERHITYTVVSMNTIAYNVVTNAGVVSFIDIMEFINRIVFKCNVTIVRAFYQPLHYVCIQTDLNWYSGKRQSTAVRLKQSTKLMKPVHCSVYFWHWTPSHPGTNTGLHDSPALHVTSWHSTDKQKSLSHGHG